MSAEARSDDPPAPVGSTDPSVLLELARSVVADAPRTLGADRTLPASLLVRQALEAVLDDWWERTVPGMAAVSDRAQQISLPFFADRSLALDVVWAWSQLSSTCHHQAYAQPPTTTELQRLIAIVGQAAETLDGSGPESSVPLGTRPAGPAGTGETGEPDEGKGAWS